MTRPLGPFLPLALLCSCSVPTPVAELDSSQSALTAEQCAFPFNANGTNTICHATGSARNPWVLLKTSEEGCVEGHSRHAGDYLDVNGGTCDGQGCLPANAPCDTTLPCCEGTCCDGTCIATTVCPGPPPPPPPPPPGGC